MSTNLNLYYLAAAPLGMAVRIVARSIMQGKTIGVMEARVEERATGKVLVKGIHVKQDGSRGPVSKYRL